MRIFPSPKSSIMRGPGVYSEEATKFCETSIVDLSYLVTVKCKVEILQNFVAFSEYMNFDICLQVKLTEKSFLL